MSRNVFIDGLKQSGKAPPSRNGQAHTPNPKPETPKSLGKNRVSGFGSKHTKDDLPAYQPFPLDAVPEPIREYVRQEAIALRCDPAYVALPTLTIASSLIGNTRAIRLKGGWQEPCVLWAVIVGNSGTMKSIAFSKAMSPVYRLQKRLRREYQQALAIYAEAKEAHKESEDGTPPPEPPVFRRVLVSDCTIEKLADLLEENVRGTLLARDELANWFNSFQRYKGKSGASDLAHWLEMFRAGPILVDRKMGPKTHYYCERAAVSITGTIQPTILARALTPDAMDAGLASRLLMAMPPRQPKKWTETEVSPEAAQAYSDVIDSLEKLYFGRDKNGEEIPHVLTLSPAAKEAWIAHYDAWALEQASVDGELAAAFSKLEAYSARLAMIHHVVTCLANGEDDRQAIGVTSIEAGVTLCHWFASEARRIYAVLSESDEGRDARQLMEFIQHRGGKITVDELRRSSRTRYPSAALAEEALAKLVGAELGKWQERPAGPQGGRTTHDFVLHTPIPETLVSPGKNGVSGYGSDIEDS